MLRRQWTHDQKIGSGELLQNEHHMFYVSSVLCMDWTHLRQTDLFLSLTKTKGFSTALFKLFKKIQAFLQNCFLKNGHIWTLRILNALRKITSNLFLNLLSNILKQIYIKNIHLSCTELGMSINFNIIICCAKQEHFSISQKLSF